jgi:predicted DNA-binding transcriptional regulator AlpA
MNGKAPRGNTSQDEILATDPKGNATFTELPLLLPIEDVALILAVSIRSVQRLNSAGDLPEPVLIRGSVRWRRADIEAWVAAGCPKRENKL